MKKKLMQGKKDSVSKASSNTRKIPIKKIIIGLAISLVVFLLISLSKYNSVVLPAVASRSSIDATTCPDYEPSTARISNGQLISQKIHTSGFFKGVWIGMKYESGSNETGYFRVYLFDSDTEEMLEVVSVSATDMHPDDVTMSLVFNKSYNTESGNYRIEIVPVDFSDDTVMIPMIGSDKMDYLIGKTQLNAQDIDGSVIIGLEYGFNRLIPCYWAIAISMFLVWCAIFTIITICQTKPEILFAITAILLGLLYVFAIFPFNSPDEDRHFGVAYYYSSVILDNNVKPIIEYQTAEYTVDKVRIYEIPGRKCDTVISNFGTSRFSAKDFFAFVDLFKVDYNTQASGKVAIPVFDDKSPLAYWPTILMVTLGRLLGFTPVWLILSARLINLAIFITLSYLGIKFMPKMKLILMCIPLLPLTASVASTCANDGMFIGLSIFCIGYIFHVQTDYAKLRWFDYLIFALCIAQIIIFEQYHILLIFLLLLIYRPNSKAKINRKTIAIICIGIIVVALLIWGIAAFAGAFKSFDNIDSKTKYGLMYVFAHPIESIGILFQTVVSILNTFIYSFGGQTIGWLDVDVGYVPVILTYFSIALAIIIEGYRSPMPGWDRKPILLLALFSIASTFMIGFKWTSPDSFISGGYMLFGLQARYFLPIVPLLLMSIHPKRIVAKPSLGKTFILMLAAAQCYSIIPMMCYVCNR